jgi:hypothetical protein
MTHILTVNELRSSVMGADNASPQCRGPQRFSVKSHEFDYFIGSFPSHNVLFSFSGCVHGFCIIYVFCASNRNPFGAGIPWSSAGIFMAKVPSECQS